MGENAMILLIRSCVRNAVVKTFIKLFVILCAFDICASSINLHRIFHHIGIDTQKVKSMEHLELAQLVLYFDQEPLINKGRKESGDTYEVLEIFFPKTQIKGLKTDELLKELKSSDGTLFYKAQFEQTAVGVKCTISFNKQHVVFDYDTFLSISSQHAVRLHFFNKYLLDKMNRAGTLLRVASAHKKPRVVVDCGHGGQDVGALGNGGICEKDITLALGREVARMLQGKGFEVCMTRSSDIGLSLDARTTLANALGACALVSIHANASKNTAISGIETFCLAPTLFKSDDSQSKQYNGIIRRYYQQLYDAGSSLAHLVHAHVLDSARLVSSTQNRQVKSAAAQVLLGAQIPATLIEVGFLSNPQEATLLADKRYQQLLAHGISNGVIEYFKNYHKQHA